MNVILNKWKLILKGLSQWTQDSYNEIEFEACRIV